MRFVIEEIERLARKIQFTPCDDANKRILSLAESALDNSIKTKPVVSQPVIWRIIMKSQISKIAIAAVFFIVCIIGLTMFNKTSGVVLANVLTQIERISTYMYDADMTMTGQIIGNTKLDAKMQGTIILSQDYGMKMTLDMNDSGRGVTMRQETYLLLKDKVLFQIMPVQKTYTRMEVDDDYVERIRNQSYDPGRTIKQILACKYNSLGISTIEGKRVEGFETDDPNYAGRMYSKVHIKLWIDVKTQLPVQMEQDFQMAGQTNTTITGVIHNYRWNVPVNASEFEPVIPDDFKTVTSGSVKMPSNTEETAIEGLKLYAGLFGSYPKELNLVTLMSQITKILDDNSPAAVQFQEELKGLNPEERSQKLIDTMMPIMGAASFYMLLVQDQKDPVYYGNIVTLADTNQVLMRWKVQDGIYHVIFGDLSAGDFTSQELAELEAKLPK
jgi:outer membrane lipoprotein-sorting protein